MKRIWCGWFGWLAVLALMAVGGLNSCSEADTGGSGKGILTGGSGGVSQIHARIELNGFSADVEAIRYSVSCDDGTMVSRVVPLEESTSPGHVTGGEYAFADFFQVLPAGAACTVLAEPLDADGGPSQDCLSASLALVVEPNVTTEVVLALECEGGGSTGAIDIVGSLNRPPVITHVQIDPSKFVVACQPAVIEAVATDPDGDEVTIDFAVIDAPAFAIYEFEADGNSFSLVTETVGTFTIQIAATDAGGASSTLTLPIHTNLSQVCEHLSEACCELPSGDIVYDNLGTCIESGGTKVDREICDAWVCCDTAAGLRTVRRSHCPTNATLPSTQVCQEPICCRSGEGAATAYTVLPAEECTAPSLTVARALCDDVCCLDAATGLYGFEQAAFCPKPSPEGLCAFVCCTQGGQQPFISPPSECAGAGRAPVPNDQCSGLVCCQIEGAPAPLYRNAAQCAAGGGQSVPFSECGPVTTDLDPPPFEPDPCVTSKQLVVPSTAANQLTVWNTEAPYNAFSGTPFNTCPGQPSRVIFDWNNDIISTCRYNGTVYKHKEDGTVLWTSALPGCTGGIRGVVIGPDGKLYVGCSGPSSISELDHATGAIIRSKTLPLSPYGFIADQNGIYVAEYASRAAKVDPATLEVAWITPASQISAYGIAVDGNGFVYTSGGSSLNKLDAATGALVGTYNYPSPPPGSVTSTFGHGMASDLLGNIYVAMITFVARFNPTTSTWQSWALPPGTSNAKGLAADSDNNIFAICQSNAPNIIKYTPAGAVEQVYGGAPTLQSPYAYGGDMTGLNLCLSTLRHEWISQPTLACSSSSTWGSVSWTALMPAGASLAVYYSLDGGATFTQATSGAPIGAASPSIVVKTISHGPNTAAVPTIQGLTVSCNP